MANSATLIDTIPATYKNNIGPVYEYEIAIDTINTPLSIRVPSVATNRLWVVGAFFSDSAALNLTLSTLTKSQTLQLAANQGILEAGNGGYLFVGAPGETLNIQSSTVITASVGFNLILRLVEAQKVPVGY